MLYNSEGPVYCKVASKTVKLISQMSALSWGKKIAAESWEKFLSPGAVNDGCSHQVTLQFNQGSLLLWEEWDYAVYLSQTANTSPLFLFIPPSSCFNGPTFLLVSFFFSSGEAPILLCLSTHHTVSSLSPLSSLTMKYTDTNLGSPSTPKTQLCGCPTFLPSNNLPANMSSTVLPTANLSLFSSLSCLLLLHPALLFSFLPSLTLTEDGSVKDKGQTKSQHSRKHLFYFAARALRCSILCLISLSVSGERHCELGGYDKLQGVQNSFAEFRGEKKENRICFRQHFVKLRKYDVPSL